MTQPYVQCGVRQFYFHGGNMKRQNNWIKYLIFEKIISKSSNKTFFAIVGLTYRCTLVVRQFHIANVQKLS